MANFVVTVRYGLMATTERFVSEFEEIRTGDQVIIRTGRGVDFGEAMNRARPHDGSAETHGELLRLANDADHSILSHIRDAREPEEFVTCQQCIRERDLPMRLVGVEHLFSGDKIIFYFLADNRVDFRELVKELARRYRTRIEMRQIGVRDEARLLADYEHCGRELCCRTFIRNLEPVTMRMAKMQKTTLDPSKISGHCGRLMCCLRFEDEVYSTLQSEIPGRGAYCVTAKFSGEVVSADMFRQLVVLALPDGNQETVHLSEITEIQGRKGKPGGQQPAGGSFPGPGRADGQGRPSGRFRVGEQPQHACSGACPNGCRRERPNRENPENTENAENRDTPETAPAQTRPDGEAPPPARPNERGSERGNRDRSRDRGDRRGRPGDRNRQGGNRNRPDNKSENKPDNEQRAKDDPAPPDATSSGAADAKEQA